MRVKKRSGEFENVSFDKVLRRIQTLSTGLDGVDAYSIAQRVCTRIFDGVKTAELDELAAQLCASLVTDHLDYNTLASRIVISNLHKNTSPSFSEVISLMYNCENPLITDELYENVQANKEKINSVIKNENDYNYDYFGFKTLERSYLTKVNNKIVERPQYLLMRVALAIHGYDLREALETYEHMSNRKFTPATPVLFNAGMRNGSLASCYLLGVDDTVAGMYKTVRDIAFISKRAGGIGLHVSNIRGRDSYIRSTNGYSMGVVPYLRVINETARHINQSGKRLGSVAVYCECTHPDIMEFLELRKNTPPESARCRDLFLALYISDLFMQRVQENGEWCLMCPDECPGLTEIYGEEYEALYLKYEAEGRYKKKMKAQEIWTAALVSQLETGTPYMVYKDAVNRKCNQKNLGCIKSSNLCTEITIFSNTEEYGTCNLSSLALPTYVKERNGEFYFDHDELHAITQIVTKNINKIIDRTYYPVPESERSNKRHRPIGIGVQGLADVFAMMRVAYDSPEAARLNREIFETIYHGAMTASVAIAKKRAQLADELDQVTLTVARRNEIVKHLALIPEEAAMKSHRGAYSSFVGSPLSEGKFQFDLWGVRASELSGRWDWESLRTDVLAYGARNSLLLAPMPTASTSQILGFNEAFEAFNSVIYQRRTLAGEFTIINKYLVRELMAMGLWTPDIKDRVLAGNGSVQHISEIPENIRALYKTVWEIRQKVLIDLAADRGIFVCQSQSLNIFYEDADLTKLTNMHFYGWKKGLKTGMYYLRTRAKTKTMAFTIDPATIKAVKEAQAAQKPVRKCDTLDENGACLMCSS